MSDPGNNPEEAAAAVGKISVASYNFALFILYFILVIFIGIQLGRVFYYRHKVRSFNVMFFILCFWLALIRSIFFLILEYILNVLWLNLTLYWLPINLQFSTFSLLVVYYAHLHHKEKAEWTSFKTNYFQIWIGTNVLFYVVAIILIILGCRYDTNGGNEPQWLDSIHGYFTGIVFLLLVVVLIYHTWKMSLLMREGRGTTHLLAKVSWHKALAVAIILSALFMSRVIYDFVTAVDDSLSTAIEGGQTYAAMYTFLALFFWEVLPIILVLVLFGTVNSTTLGSCCGDSKSEHRRTAANIQPKKITDTPDALTKKAKIFANPKRYDSDDETSLLKASPASYYRPYLVPTNGSLNSEHSV